MLENIPYSTYRLGNLITLSENLTNKTTTNHPKDAMIIASAEKVKSTLPFAQKALGSSTGSLITAAVSAADGLRDTCYSSLRDYVKAGLGRDTHPKYQEASRKLWQVFKANNVRLAKLPYREESAAIKSLLADLEGLDDQLKIINGTTWVKELKEANENFDKLMGDRTEESVSKVDLPTDQVAKAELINSLKIFVATVNSLSSFGQPNGIDDTVEQLNQLIKEANQAARS